MIAATEREKLDDLQEGETIVHVTFYAENSSDIVALEGMFCALRLQRTTRRWFIVVARRNNGVRAIHWIPVRDVIQIETIDV